MYIFWLKDHITGILRIISNNNMNVSHILPTVRYFVEKLKYSLKNDFTSL